MHSSTAAVREGTRKLSCCSRLCVAAPGGDKTEEHWTLVSGVSGPPSACQAITIAFEADQNYPGRVKRRRLTVFDNLQAAKKDSPWLVLPPKWPPRGRRRRRNKKSNPSISGYRAG